MASNIENEEVQEDAELPLLTDNLGKWVKKKNGHAVQIAPTSDDRGLANLLIERAHEYATASKTEAGVSLAAAFDLFVSTKYYAEVTDANWLYCPKTSPLLIYNFGANACSRCLLMKEFYYHPASKPASGVIGNITRQALYVFLTCLFKRSNSGFKVYIGSEPVDIVVYDESTQTALLAEVKAGPLTVLPLTSPAKQQIQGNDASNTGRSAHRGIKNFSVNSAPLSIMLPIVDTASQSGWSIKLLPLATLGQSDRLTWARKQVQRVLVDDEDNLLAYFQFWARAYDAYKNGRKSPIDAVFWLTGACGAPRPKPDQWRKGKTISDSKTTVGMDRTDDIKKATYQVLKIAIDAKPSANYQVRTALISNIHAVRHYKSYLQDFQDVVWMHDETQLVGKASKPPAGKILYNLFDGILAFTQVHSRDEWITNAFKF